MFSPLRADARKQPPYSPNAPRKPALKKQLPAQRGKNFSANCVHAQSAGKTAPDLPRPLRGKQAFARAGPKFTRWRKSAAAISNSAIF
ncbi:MAG: hypothetical protein BHW65_03790 [Verrucomicrobia bacterium CAG:312_58_20]|nr:MAG: hypothetical protein BHW65_03790 [Verrucomicrobia bacterium CAG:312_58_20]